MITDLLVEIQFQSSYSVSCAIWRAWRTRKISDWCRGNKNSSRGTIQLCT